MKLVLIFIGLGCVTACGASEDASKDTGTPTPKGNPSGLAGSYLITSKTSFDPCTGTAIVTTDVMPPYFVIADNLGPETTIDAYYCDAPHGASCHPEFSIIANGKKMPDGSYHTEGSSKGGSATACYISYTANDLALSGTAVNITNEIRSGELMGSTCEGPITEDDIAVARMGGCLHRHVLVAQGE